MTLDISVIYSPDVQTPSTADSSYIKLRITRSAAVAEIADRTVLSEIAMVSMLTRVIPYAKF